MAVSANHNGWRYDPANSRLDFYYRGTRVGAISATDIASAGTITATGGISGTTWTGSGDVTLSGAGSDFISAAGNVQIGNPGAFATTQPQGAVVMGGASLSGIAPVGAITTAGAVFASDTVVRKIIAAGTASNVET